MKLLENGHEVICCARDKSRFNTPQEFKNQIEVLETDFLNRSSLSKIPKNIDGAYYLIHSMSSGNNFQELEKKSAKNFREALSNTNVRHVVYLSGIVNESTLSKHLKSRKVVEEELALGDYHLTTLRAGIIIGSGSASFEIIRDLVEKLPIMIAPKWLNTKSQPIGIRDVISILINTLFNEATFNKNFDIGGPDIISYKDMLLGYAKIRQLKRWIFTVPVMTPQLSSYWLFFITSTSFKLAVALVNSMKIEIVCRESDINKISSVTPVGYQESLKRTFSAYEKKEIVSGWRDSLVSGNFNRNLSDFFQVPTFGCFVDKRTISIKDHNRTLNKIWQIGGDTGWYYANWLWGFRGVIDKLFGGIGLRRSRTSMNRINPGDAIDFWRVIYADRFAGTLLLFAEMKLPGEAWLEFKIENKILFLTATFQPKGLLGRLYWYALVPFHNIIFNGMIKRIAS